MDIKAFFKKKGMSPDSKIRPPRSQGDILFMGAIGVLILFAIVITIDAHVFYTTVLTPETEPATEASLVFPERELKTLTQLLDAREEKFLLSLPAPEAPKKK